MSKPTEVQKIQQASLFKDELVNLPKSKTKTPTQYNFAEIDGKYMAGEVRIITEQARYPLPTIPGMLASNKYNLNPEFQRRRRWSNVQRSRLIESFIMNVPIPPVFLYEVDFSKYEVMDGLQRMTAILEFYNNKFRLEGLSEWNELNGLYYKELPPKVQSGVDRRYLSSIVLLQETAKNKSEADRLKKLVFERINSGGVQLEGQETRNALYDGPLNQLCIKLSRDQNLCGAWGIPAPKSIDSSGEVVLEPDELKTNEDYRKMVDVELVLRFFAYRQRLLHQHGALREYLDAFLIQGNAFSQNILDNYEVLFRRTIALVYETLGDKSFFLYRKRKAAGWYWLRRPTTTVYDPIMYVFSALHKHSEQILSEKKQVATSMSKFYKANHEDFEGRYTNRKNAERRIELLMAHMKSFIK